MDYLNRFTSEHQAGRVNLTIMEKGYKKRAGDLYPRKLTSAEIILHAVWIGAALVFAFRTSEMSLPGTVAASLGGMAAAIVIGKFIPLGSLFGGIILLIGIATLPFYFLAGPIGIFGLSSVSRSFRTRHGKNLVRKWCLDSEEQFLGAVTEGIIAVTGSENANEDTDLFLSQLEEATGRRDGVSTRETSSPDQPDGDADTGKSAEFTPTQVDFYATEEFYKESLANTEKNFGPDHPDVAAGLNNLAVLYRNHGNYAAAEPLYKRSIDIREKALGPNHPDVATSLNNLAVLYANLNNYAAAEPLYKRSIDIREKTLGPNHPDVAKSLKNLAVLYRATNREDEASELEKRAEAMSDHKVSRKDKE